MGRIKKRFMIYILIPVLLCAIGAALVITGCEDLALLQEFRQRVGGYVTGVSLNKNSMAIYIGSAEQLAAVVEPVNAMDTSITWTSDNDGVASVDSSGLVTGIAEGAAAITGTTTDGGFTDTCEVLVQKIWTASQSGSAGTAGSSVTYTNHQNNFSFKLKACPGAAFPTGEYDSGGPETVNTFWIGETEVTYELWYSVKEWSENSAVPAYTFANDGREGNDGIEGANPTGADQEPVTRINWRDEMIWCNALTEYYNASNDPDLSCVYFTDSEYTIPIRDVNDSPIITWGPGPGSNDGSQDDPYIKADANGFRLLTANEWELAARWRDDDVNTVEGYTSPWFTKGNSASGATTYFNDSTGGAGEPGKSANAAVAVYGDYWDGDSWEPTGVDSTAEVKTKAANSLGVYDMSGNVQEWCFDWYPGDEGSGRVLRGGSWFLSTFDLEVSLMYSFYPYFGYDDIGFRFSRIPD